MDVKSGFIIITDISGYTRFLVESELAHAKEILDTLLSTTVEAMRPPVNVIKTEGDAVFGYVDDGDFLQPQSLLEMVEGLYFEFRRQRKLMDLNTTCTCNACINMASLDLKVFLHHGEYVEQTITESTDLQGSDVILATLLMKNSVTERTGLVGYGLLSESAVAALGGRDLLPDATDHVEAYEHFGEVRVLVLDLAARWDDLESARVERDPDDAWLHIAVDTAASQWKAWDFATDKGKKREFYDMISVDRTDDLGGRVRVGSSYHCAHEMGDVRFVITDWNPPHGFEADEVALGIPVHYGLRIDGIGDGSRIHIMYDTPDVPNPERVRPVFENAANDALGRLKAMLEA